MTNRTGSGQLWSHAGGRTLEVALTAAVLLTVSLLATGLASAQGTDECKVDSGTPALP